MVFEFNWLFYAKKKYKKIELKIARERQREHPTSNGTRKENLLFTQDHVDSFRELKLFSFAH